MDKDTIAKLASHLSSGLGSEHRAWIEQTLNDYLYCQNPESPVAQEGDWPWKAAAEICEKPFNHTWPWVAAIIRKHAPDHRIEEGRGRLIEEYLKKFREQDTKIKALQERNDAQCQTILELRGKNDTEERLNYLRGIIVDVGKSLVEQRRKTAEFSIKLNNINSISRV